MRVKFDAIRQVRTHRCRFVREPSHASYLYRLSMRALQAAYLLTFIYCFNMLSMPAATQTHSGSDYYRAVTYANFESGELPTFAV